MNRIKSIDGLRAISIMMVLLSHAGETMPAIVRNNYFLQFFANGQLGVRVFFVISGYLITKLLIIERQKNGKINLKHFYLRRIFRIFPIFYMYIFVILLIKWFFIPDIVNSYNTVLLAGLYVWNYAQFFHNAADPKGGWFFGHFWSLAMEEQFYLLWPVAFGVIASKIKLKKIVVGIIIIMPVLRLLTYVFIPVTRGQIRLMLHTGGDTILIGCLGAIIESEANFKEKYLKYIQNTWLVALSAIFLVVISHLIENRFKGGYDLSVGISLNNICILFILFWCVYVPSGFAKLLNTRLFLQVGILSYSIYIWQQLILTSMISTWFNKFPQNMAVVFVVGIFSYYVIEKPILKLKHRFKDI